jgi:dihydrofolate reductase
MRKIVAGLFVSLDGVIDNPQEWNPPYYDDELSQAVMPQVTHADLHLYGRRSYELFRGVFTGPNRPPHAAVMTDKPKVVVSSTLRDPDWGPTTVIRRDVAAELSKLKEQPGGTISVGASGELVRFLATEGLLDELSLLVHPVLVGTGRHLFENGTTQVPLELVEARTHHNGVVALSYTRPERPAP